ncbi:MAG: hypothetical protein DI564_04050 [Rhodanobacter denitrificans]|uniref:DUF4124 domain-containing protein n=1 Tax=Rhodanobacter denitrificans TaxID=666685 RepID=A0A2W5KN44_9GAMM|nr:MAG: hypothetical protein DI564_04050 [Rhodanobacter denitrificans]
MWPTARQAGPGCDTLGAPLQCRSPAGWRLPMRRWPLVLLCLLALPVLAEAAGNARVYTWKDANGVTHFSDSPPPASVKSARQITVRGDTPVAAGQDAEGAEAAAPPAEGTPPPGTGGATLTDSPEARQQVCEQARRNAELLEGQQQVSMDVDGSGSNQVLTPEQRQQQLAQARERVAFYCR